MASSVAVVIGGILILVVLADVFRTVLWSGQGAGPLTGAVTALGRRLLPHLPGNRVVRSALGPTAIIAIVAIWTSLLLAGFILMLEGDPDAVRSSSTGEPVDRVGRAYFVGYTMFTLGNGELVPSTDATRFLTVAITAMGMLLITLSVTYLVPVVSASVASRAFASSTMSLGASPEDVLIGAWDGTRLRLHHQLRELSSALSLLAEQQLAYPVLHLFHSPSPGTAAPLAVKRLDDVLTLLDGVDQRAAPVATVRRQMRASINAYLETYGRDVGDSGAPPPPDTGRLAAAGIPVLDPTAYAIAVADIADHRADVADLVRASGGQDHL